MSDQEPAVEMEGSLVLKLIDAFNRPIEGLAVSIESADGVFKTTTNTNGATPPLSVNRNDPPLKLHVAQVIGGEKHVATIQPDGGAQLARIDSPKAAVKANLRRHDGAPGLPHGNEPRPPGDERSTRSTAGHPVLEVALECPNPQNLKLRANFKYRNIILDAAKRTGITAHTVCAIMNAEAGTIPERYHSSPVIDSKTNAQKKDKKGNLIFTKVVDDDCLPDEWDPQSANSRSSARGMTQFLDSTWIEIACIENTHLNARVKKEGWLTVKLVENTKKAKASSHTVPAFKLTNGTLVTGTAKGGLAVVLSQKPYVTGWARATDANLQALLDLRFEPEYAINAAVDYVLYNFVALRKAGYNVDGLSDGEKAKMGYLGHHLGPSDAKRYINERITEESAKHLLTQQVGEGAAAVLAKIKDKKDGKGNDTYSYQAAHRQWLNSYVNKKIVFQKFYCADKAPEIDDLLKICERIKKDNE